MRPAGLYNLDCLKALKDYPDDYFDLAIADPPYGAGLTENGGCKGWFTKYHQKNSGGGGTTQSPIPRRGQVEQVQDITRSGFGSAARVIRADWKQARKYEKNCNVGHSPG